MNILDLKKPFPPAAVSWRVGSTTGDKTKGMALAYIDARDVQDRFDEVCGPENWQCRFPLSDGKRIICEIGVRIGGEWVWKSDGAGDTDMEGEKGAISDAFKRAAVKWGVGRYLYDLPAPWVALEPMGHSFKIKDSEHTKLQALLSKDAKMHQAQQDSRQEPAGQQSDAPDFWAKRPYSVRGNGPEVFGRNLCLRMKEAPSQEALVQVWEDNESHIKALPDEVYKGCQEYMGKRMGYWSQHPTGKAA